IDFQGGCGTVISWTNQNPDETYLIEVAAFQPVIVSTTTRKGEERTNQLDTLFLELGEELAYTAAVE
ncbi:MAG: hypothetical protein AAF519_08370, partial [Bacteroidota bacterium]